VAVVDPGVGTGRAILCAQVAGQTYVAPDNGLLSRLMRKPPQATVFRVAKPEHWLTPVSTTFHGRDIMAPVAARLSLGLDPAELGPPLAAPVDLDWPEPRPMPGRIEGEVLAVDRFGNLMSNIPAEMLARLPDGARPRVFCKDRQTDGLTITYAERPRSTLVALIGSSGRLEVAMVEGNAAAALCAKVGDAVVVTW
jgi:S-adenosylmethionine hydrolase